MNWKKIIFPAFGFLVFNTVNAQVVEELNSSKVNSIKDVSLLNTQQVESRIKMEPLQTSTSDNEKTKNARTLDGAKMKLEISDFHRALIENTLATRY